MEPLGPGVGQDKEKLIPYLDINQYRVKESRDDSPGCPSGPACLSLQFLGYVSCGTTDGSYLRLLLLFQREEI